MANEILTYLTTRNTNQKYKWILQEWNLEELIWASLFLPNRKTLRANAYLKLDSKLQGFTSQINNVEDARRNMKLLRSPIQIKIKGNVVRGSDVAPSQDAVV